MTYQRELWERSNLPYIKGGDAYKCKRRTKAEVGRKYGLKGDYMSPELDTKVQEGADDIELGVSYEIINVEPITTEVQSYQGQRVSLMSPQGDEGNVVLWQRKVTGKTSKLGVFIETLGHNTDKWLHKWIVFRQWTPRNRIIEVLEGKDAKGLKSAFKK